MTEKGRSPMKAPTKQSSRLSASARRCLASLLDAELDGEPVEFYTWRAKNAKKIPVLQDLRRNRMIEGDEHCGVTLWGLMNAPGERAEGVMAECERIFKALRKFYPLHPKEPISLEDLAKQTKLPPADALRSAHILSRSPAFLGIHTHEQKTKISPNEQYVTFSGFDGLKEKAREQARRAARAGLPNLLAPNTSHTGLMWILDTSESEAVRECWRKAVERVSTDPAGAITAARSLVEAACKYVIEESGETADMPSELPRLHKKAAELLKLDPRSEIAESLRRVLQASATIVDGLAYLRNRLGDAHGKGRNSAKPAKRHAEFVVMIAGAMTGLLLATLDAQRTP
jgi:hypothetical protein